MSKKSKVKAETEPLDYERMAAEQRLKRQERCWKAIQEMLAKERCELVPVLQIGETQVNVSQVLLFPSGVGVVAK
jgi:hypothetical protein